MSADPVYNFKQRPNMFRKLLFVFPLTITFAYSQGEQQRFTKEIEQERTKFLTKTSGIATNDYQKDRERNHTPSFINIKEAYQAKPLELPLAEVNTDPKKVNFISMDLSPTATDIEQTTRKKTETETFYAFRFKTPDQPGTFIFSANFPNKPKRLNWYVVPITSSGPIDLQIKRVIFYPRYSLPENIPDLGKAGTQYIVYPFEPEALAPNTEYVIAFSAEAFARNRIIMSLNYFPLSYRYSSYMEIFPMFYPNFPDGQPATDAVPSSLK
ncbi:hypothetical protein P0Y35_04255 [Kiritimatiellaeota bacterium B1221]|nr:hypothetical protein [Kiritimatiellaeota bacterium B1221]